MDFQALSTAYTGATATGYEARRTSTAKWLSEQIAVAELLRVVPSGATVLDIPVGTGRFLELYQERGLKVAGRDISPDMLRAARNKLNEVGGLDCSLELADIRTIPDADDQYDCVLSIRFLNWVDSRGLEEVLREAPPGFKALPDRYHPPQSSHARLAVPWPERLAPAPDETCAQTQAIKGRPDHPA